MRALRSICLILISVIILCLSLSSCMDMGEVADAEQFKDCFDSVHLLDRGEHSTVSIGSFSAFEADSSYDIEQVLDPSEYCYIAFQAADGYTLTVSELAFFAKIEGEGVLNYEVYVTDALPEMILNSDGSYTTYPNGLGTVPNLDPSTAVTESIFSEDCLVGSAALRTDSDWDSTHLKLDRAVVLSEENYLVIKFTDNCVKIQDGTAEGEPPVYGELLPLRFTVNYLLFYFDEIVN